MQVHTQLERNSCADSILFLPLTVNAMEGLILCPLSPVLLLQGGDSAVSHETADLESAFCRGRTRLPSQE